MALMLSTEKAISISKQNKSSIVFASDQILVCQNKILHKPNDLETAKKNLKWLQGNTHRLFLSTVACINGKRAWSCFSKADLTMRALTCEQIEQYLALENKNVLDTVGCYMLESKGLHLFENIKGDYYTILGFPIMDVLLFLRKQGIDTL